MRIFKSWLTCSGALYIHLTPELDNRDLEDGTFISCSSTTQRVMTLRLALDESRKTADSSDVHMWPIGFGVALFPGSHVHKSRG